MKNMHGVQGQCLCGDIKFEINGEATAFYVCHCSRCRHHTGSANASNIFAKAEALTWLAGEDAIRRFKLPEAKRFTKQFCSKCGSPVPHVSDNGKYLLIPAGSLNEDIDVVPQANIFWESKSCWVESARQAPFFSEYPAL